MSIACNNPMPRRTVTLVECLAVVERLALVALVCGTVACSTQPVLDEPLTPEAMAEQSPMAGAVQGDRDDEILVLLALSGGGTRAAAFAYGVLQELAATTVRTSRGERRLLDEVDIISSVSGGSFVNAYYGLYGDRIFDDFEQRFLRLSIQSDLTKGLFKPANWSALGSRDYGRSDMAAELYDDKLFDNKTFSDFKRPGAPHVIINSTDIASGTRISFTRPMFNLLCADLDQYPVSRAVAASSAVPGMATPITLKNYAGQCGLELPTWLNKAAQASGSTLAGAEAQALTAYLDTSEHPWLHLVDGGVSDNLGLRAFYTIFSVEHDPEQVLRDLGHENVKQVLMISVNAAAQHLPEWAAERDPPRVKHVLGSMTDVLMSRYTGDTTHIVRTAYSQWAKTRQAGPRPVSFEFVEVSFAGVGDAQERRRLNDTVTSLQLDDEEIDRLIGAGRAVLRESDDFGRFLGRNEGRDAVQ